MTQLHAQTRDPNTNATTLREQGLLPAVFYGPKDESTPITLNTHDFLRVWEGSGGSAIIDLTGVGDEDKEVLIHEVAWHPVKHLPLHVDLYCFERGKKLNVTVPISYVGESPVEKEGGIVVKILHEIEVEVRPRDIPHEIEVDISQLTGLDSSITIGDLKLPEGVEATLDSDETIASVTQAKEEPAEEEEERDITDIEIEGEVQHDDDGDEASESANSEVEESKE